MSSCQRNDEKNINSIKYNSNLRDRYSRTKIVDESANQRHPEAKWELKSNKKLPTKTVSQISIV